MMNIPSIVQMKKTILVWVLLVSVVVSSWAQKNLDLRKVVTFNAELSDIWGFESNNREYALVGLVNGLSIVDVTDPDNAQEIFFIQGPSSTWRDIKTRDEYAYVTNETGEGLLIVDLTDLPNSINSTNWIADSLLWTAHNIYIDEKGRAYMAGHNSFDGSIPYEQRGALIADLTQDPMAPVLLGQYQDEYCHDVIARGDTLWTSEMGVGRFGVVDVTDPANPFKLADNRTPNFFTHNAWISDDNNYLFTTDERPGAFVAAYDVSDLDNIQEVDRWQADPGSNLIPHNTHYKDGYLITAYYKYGVNIIDASKPDNLVEVGQYDTSPFINSDGFAGCWGAYPYLSSGNILATDIEEGLFILTPKYVRASYLEGSVTDLSQGFAIQNARVEFIGQPQLDFTGLQGEYRTGVADSGEYDVRFVRDGCQTQIFTDVQLRTGQVTTLDVQLDCLTSVGVEEVTNGVTWKAQPSVFQQQTTLSYSQQYWDGETATVTVHGMDGKQWERFDIYDANTKITVGANWPAGIYVASMFYQGETYTLKILKQ